MKKFSVVGGNGSDAQGERIEQLKRRARTHPTTWSSGTGE